MFKNEKKILSSSLKKFIILLLFCVNLSSWFKFNSWSNLQEKKKEKYNLCISSICHSWHIKRKNSVVIRCMKTNIPPPSQKMHINLKQTPNHILFDLFYYFVSTWLKVKLTNLVWKLKYIRGFEHNFSLDICMILRNHKERCYISQFDVPNLIGHDSS